MTFSNSLPILIILSALLPGLVTFFIHERQVILRRALNLGGNVTCLVLIGLLINGVYSGEVFETRLPLLPAMDLVLHADALSLLFVSLSGLLWFLTSIYAIGYLDGTQNRSRFFGFFSLCVAATLGIALAGNLITFLIFYELLTLTTYPLVVHKGNAASLRAGRIYLAYTMIGGALLLAGVVWLKTLAGSLEFTATGVLSGLPHLDPDHLKIIFVLLLTGLGVKAALVPLHGWLPIAMAAPAPVSALLHAVAVVKAGAFGIIRVVYDVYGIEFTRDLGLTVILGAVAAFTIVYGSILAIYQDDLKKRLAYSTVSQVSYIALGTAIAGPIATIGGMIHLVHQGLMKITLFFCAGNLAETLKVHKVSGLNGVGRRMPLTMTAFTIAALGMIGLPPIAGFVSKWYLGAGALEVDAYWVLVILAISSLLNALYFLPILHAAWFKTSDTKWAVQKTKLETHWMLLLPPVLTAALAVAAGIFASSAISPLSWSELIAAREYGQSIFPNDPSAAFLSSPLGLGWVVLAPLVVAVGVLIPLTRQWSIRLSAFAALPALFVALLASPTTTVLPTLFFGSVLTLDDVSRVILLLAATLWLLAGIYAKGYLANDTRLTRYTLFFLLCMAGSFGLSLSQDLFGFLTFFTLMSLSAYGFVVHTGTEEAFRAGKTYMQWVVIGELLLFAALAGLSSAGNSVQPLWVSSLLLIGFGIKAGLLSTHFWLPRAHPVAPVPASAVLSGLMVKAGLIGWWRFLPLGDEVLLQPGMLLIILGFAGAFWAAIAGWMQRDPKTLLAYSTISQMGVMAAGVGIGLMYPHLWSALSAALLLYVLHHGFAKAALFFSVGIAPIANRGSHLKWWLWFMFLVPVITMIGLPLTSGSIAKATLKISVDGIAWFEWLLSLSAVGTTLLMLRFIELLKQLPVSSRPTSQFTPQIIATCLTVLIILTLGLGVPVMTGIQIIAPTSISMFDAIWPPFIGLLLFIGLYHFRLRIHPVRKPMIQSKPEILENAWKTISDGRTSKLSFEVPLISRIKRNIPSAVEAIIVRISQISIHPGVVLVSLLLCFALMFAVGQAPIK